MTDVTDLFHLAHSIPTKSRIHGKDFRFPLSRQKRTVNGID